MRFNYQELNKYFAEPLPDVEVVAKALTDHSSEVEEIIKLDDGNYELEVKILPDRAGDAKTPLGLAHEINALLPELKLREDWLVATKDTARAQINFSFEQINNLLGLNLTAEEIAGFLNRVRVAVVGTEDLIALVPPERLDLNIKEDLADEVARLYGYDRVPTRTLSADIAVKHNETFVLANQIRAQLASEGYNEVYGYTFTDHGEVEVLKPLASDKAYLRVNLTDGLKKIIEFNLGYTLFDQDEVKVFEIGSVFVGGSEEVHIVVGSGKKKPELKIEVIEKKLTEFDLKDLKNNLSELNKFINKNVHYQPVSAYPRIIRDIAVWVPESTTIETVSELIKKSAGELLVEGPVLFDDFAKEGRKSLAFRLVFQANNRTLLDSEVSEQMTQVVASLESQTGFEVRK